MCNSITCFHAHAHLVRKITTSEIWEIIPHLAYLKIMHAEYLVCNNTPIYADDLGLGPYIGAIHLLTVVYTIHTCICICMYMYFACTLHTCTLNP